MAHHYRFVSDLQIRLPGEWNLFGVTLALTGKKITYRGVGIWRNVDGKVVEGWGVYDQMDFLKQLGIIEPPENGKNLFPDGVK